MSLLRAEWKRFFARRVTRVMVLIVLLLMGIVAAALAGNSHRATAADRASAEQMVQQQIAEMQSQQLECASQVAAGTMQLPPGQTCDSMFSVTGDNAPKPEYFLPHTWIFATEGSDAVLIFGGLLALFGFVVGASFVGAEWHSGAMMNLLLWRPRRSAVLTAKLTALATSVLGIGVALAAVWVGVLSVIASTRGYFGHMTSGVIQSLALEGLRGLALGVVAAILAFALASIGRHTATALGVAIAYVITWEAGGQILFASLRNRINVPERFFLSTYVEAWMKKFDVFGWSDCNPVGGCVQHSFRITMTTASEVVGAVVIAVLAWAYVAMARRDVA